MKKLHRYTLTAGLALIAITNAIALGGAAYNRSGQPDSSLALSDRELQVPYAAWSESENSGLSLRLNWRVLPVPAPGDSVYGYFGGRGSTPAWLDAQKMASLGFSPDAPTAFAKALSNNNLNT